MIEGGRVQKDGEQPDQRMAGVSGRGSEFHSAGQEFN